MAKGTRFAVVLNRITKSYKQKKREIPVLQGIDLAVPQGEWVALTGASGCGKTTLLHVIGLLTPRDTGDLSFFGTPVPRRSLRQASLIRRQQLGFVFQSYQLFPELTAMENVMLAGRIAGMPPSKCQDKALTLIEKFGLGHRLRHRPAELTGGEQQRIAIARALINDPAILLADEPTGNLDDENAERVIAIFQKLHNQDGKTIVMVTHDRDLAHSADRVLVMDSGVVHAEDSANGVRQ